MKELYAAIRANDAAQVKSLVDADPTLAIFAAAVQGDVAGLETLLEGNRALVSALSTDGWTPLHLAAHFGRTEAARLLLNKGAVANSRSANALQNMPLHAAAAGRAAGVAKLLIDHGANVNARQHGGWTALHAAAQNGDIDTATVLIESGADISVRADNQQRPMDLAMTKGHGAMVEFLEAKGAAL
jgi:uncharacterized protein